jgi:hypothetical protein
MLKSDKCFPTGLVNRETMRLPSSFNELTPSFLTQLLQRETPGVVVQNVDISGVNEGTTSRARLTLDYNDVGIEAGLPRTMWLKSWYNSLRSRQHLIGAVIGETVFYRFAPDLPIRTIRAFYSGIDQEDQGLVLLEDLANAGTTFLSAVKPLTVEQARDGLDQLARLHGAYWDLPRPDEEQDWPVFANDGPLGRAMRGWVIPTLPEIMSQPHLQGRIPDALMNGRFGQGMSKLLDMTSRGPHCLIHFDPHLGNISLNRDGEIVLMDWQFFRAGHWSHDVSYFISSVLTTEDRRQAERDLLAYYLERLRAHGGQPPSFETAWHFYVAGQLYGVFSWVCTQLEMQTLETIYTLLDRHLKAIEDLGTLELLEV